MPRKGYKFTEEHKRNISLGHKGQIPWNKDKKLSEDHKRKVKENHSHSKPWLGKKRGIGFQIKCSMRQTGEKTFSGFRTHKIRRLKNTTNYKNWRNDVFERDDYTCQMKNCVCCNNKRGVELHPHHLLTVKEYPEFMFYTDNGVALCKDSHMKLHGLSKGGIC